MTTNYETMTVAVLLPPTPAALSINTQYFVNPPSASITAKQRSVIVSISELS
jgi:hypothetical protein